MRGLLNKKPLPNPLLKGEGICKIDSDIAETNFHKKSNIQTKNNVQNLNQFSANLTDVVADIPNLHSMNFAYLRNIEVYC